MLRFLQLLCGFALSLFIVSSASASDDLALGKNLRVPVALVSYQSAHGVQLLAESRYKRAFLPLTQYFTTQMNQAYCGVASLTMVLNALDVQRPYSSTYAPYRIYTQSNIFTPKAVKLFNPTLISGHGLTLEQLSRFAAVFPVDSRFVHAFASNKAYTNFMAQAQHALSVRNQFIIVNYARKQLGQVGGGHFSPLAAYDQMSDRFLLLDVSRYKYPPVWVKSKQLWRAMVTQDTTSYKNRGYVIVKSG